MKLKLLLMLMFTMLCFETFSQTTITIPNGNTAGTGVTSTSVRRKPLGSNRSYERTAIKFSQNEIGTLGNISGIAFYCDTVINPGRTPVKIYIKEVLDTVFTAASTVTTEETNATLVYSDTLASSMFVKNTWTNITFSTPFLHANNSNIEIIIETNSGGTNGTDLTSLSKGFRYNLKGITNTMQYWQSNANSSTIPTGNGTLSSARPNIQMIISTAPSCVAPPDAGITISNTTSACAGSAFNLSLTGTTTGLGLSYQWLSSSNSTSWDTIVGATQNALNTSQITNKYYACIVMCSGQKDTSSSIYIPINPFYLCYCTTSLGGACSGPQGTAIDSISFTGTTLEKGSTGCSANAYASYPSTGNTTANLYQGESYTLAAKFTGNVKSSLWIDFNQNGIFENSEWRQIGLTSATGTVVNASIYIPNNATPGMTGMRIRSRTSNSQNDSTSACANFGNSGETEDYLINIIASLPCTAPPIVGTLETTDTLTCIGSNVTLSLVGNSSGSGQTFEWYSSTNGTNWNLISGVTDKIYTVSISGDMYVQCKLTCSGLSSLSNIIHLVTKPFYNCYCVSGIGGNCNQQATAIDSVAIVGTNLNIEASGCSGTYYTSYEEGTGTTASLNQGESYTLYTKFTGNVRASVWIDYNQNGIYENKEWQQICTSSIANRSLSTNLNIPMSALTGKTGMRIRSRAANGANDSTSACATFGSGETEDYVVTILASTPCVQPPNAGTTQSSSSSVCVGTKVNFSIVGNTSGTGQTYQWIKSIGNNVWVNVAGQISKTLADTVYQNTSYACVLNCSGFSDTSSISAITINPFYNCYCSATIGGGCVNSATSIDSVAIVNTTLDNYALGCASTFYTAYPAVGNTTAHLYLNDSYAMQTKFSGIVNASVWIDFNQNGNFDSTEWTLLTDTSIANQVTTSFIEIPSNAKLGKTGMRIRTRSIAGVNTAVNACTTFGSGETEDYVITIDTVVIIQGVNNYKNDSYLKVYPNPASTSITIAQTKLKNGTLLIYDLQGRLITKEELTENISTISTQKLENGMYLYHYIDQNLSIKSSGKISIQK